MKKKITKHEEKKNNKMRLMEGRREEGREKAEEVEKIIEKNEKTVKKTNR